MQQSDDLSPLEIVEMFAGLSCFLKDSSDVSQTLLDDFRMCQGYAFLCDLMLRYRLRGTWPLRWLNCSAERFGRCFIAAPLCPDWSRPRRTSPKTR